MLYHKIPGPFKRSPDTNKVMPGVFTTPEIEALYTAPVWVFTEKIDGMNMRAMWDGHEVTFGGRTDRAQIPGDLLERMQEIFTEEKFEQAFGDKPVVVFGEGYGPKIQGGGYYGDQKDFIGFDVAVNGSYLAPYDARSAIVECFGAQVVDALYEGTLEEAVEDYGDIVSGPSYARGVPIEGFVGTTTPGLLDKRGNRIVTKVKGVDFA